MRVVCAAALACCLAASSAQARCGPDPDPCTIEAGQYHTVLPTEVTDAPVVLYLHGAGGSGANVVRNDALISAFTDRGYAVIAPSALPRRPGATGGVWSFYPDWEGRDEPAFLAAVVADSAARFGHSGARVLLTGFSAGAFMVSYLACETPGLFPAYAPLAGAFWRPHPARCAGPVNLFQTHGWRDSTVPLEGRPLGGGRFEQGDVFASMEIWRRANRCPNMAPDSFATEGQFMRRSWEDCDPNSTLHFALFPGGHTIPEGWADMILSWFETDVP